MAELETREKMVVKRAIESAIQAYEEASLTHKVAQFHGAFGIPVQSKPAVPSADRVKLRLRLIAEEFCETMRAAGVAVTAFGVERELARAIDEREDAVDMVEFVDGLADLQVVIAGTELEFGVYGAAVLDEVMASNLSKIGSTVRDDGKIMKDAPGFFRPDIAKVLKTQGWIP